jgi:hypothetical protein
MNRRVFVLAAVALSGCATAAPPQVRAGPQPLAELEPLYRADAGRDALTISVASNGCTAREDFTFHAERRDDAVSLAFARRRIDTCKSFAMGRTDLTFTWVELGVAPHSQVFLLNPVTAWTGPGR